MNNLQAITLSANGQSIRSAAAFLAAFRSGAVVSGSVKLKGFNLEHVHYSLTHGLKYGNGHYTSGGKFVGWNHFCGDNDTPESFVMGVLFDVM
jgi:hypothetical protein